MKGLALHLRKRFFVQMATSAEEVLPLLAQTPPAAVVIADMRMPGMNGAQLLAHSRKLYPQTTRMLLTSYADLDAAVSAINEGQVFRVIVKPCPPPELLKNVEAAVTLHDTLCGERTLLEQTIVGSIEALCEVLALTNPLAFGRTLRIKHLVSRMADGLGLAERWQVDVASMLSQLGSVTLPTETAEKLYYGVALTSAEEELLARSPEVTRHLIGHIPRLEPVHEILDTYRQPYRSAEGLTAAQATVRIGGQLLKAAVDFDAAETRGLSRAATLKELARQPEAYAPDALRLLGEIVASAPAADLVREVALSELQPGMELATDVKFATGALFVARGYQVTQSFLERVRNLRHGSIKEPLSVVIRAASDGQG